MERFRLIVTSIILFVYLLYRFPFQTILTALLLAIGYFVLTRFNSANTEYNSATTRRQNALRTAQIYLAPYNNIWRNLTLSNKFCALRLGYDGKTITCFDKNNPDRRFSINPSTIYTSNELWDLLCTRFSYNTSFEGIIELCRIFHANIDMKEPEIQKNANTDINIINSDTTKIVPQKEKLDINNASEVEITALPGISIVLAKKLIKRRHELKGFKSVNEVCEFLKLKPHMEKQLRELICINKMKGSKQIKRYNERNIDL